jgi:uncharacterized protein (DUF169 family)
MKDDQIDYAAERRELAKLTTRPVAFRLFYRETGLIFQDEQTAAEVAASIGVNYQGLYVRDGR